MAIITTFPLPDGPIIGSAFVISERATTIYHMARQLLAEETYADHADAKRSLRAAGFSAFNIAILVDDARQVAMQHVVEREMAQS